MLVDKWIKNCEIIIYKVEYYLAIQRKGNPAICNNMDGPWGYYAKWRKSGRERQILHDLKLTHTHRG